MGSETVDITWGIYAVKFDRPHTFYLMYSQLPFTKKSKKSGLYDKNIFLMEEGPELAQGSTASQRIQVLPASFSMAQPSVPSGHMMAAAGPQGHVPKQGGGSWVSSHIPVILLEKKIFPQSMYLSFPFFHRPELDPTALFTEK